MYDISLIHNKGHVHNESKYSALLMLELNNYLKCEARKCSYYITRGGRRGRKGEEGDGKREGDRQTGAESMSKGERTSFAAGTAAQKKKVMLAMVQHNAG